MNKSLKYFRNLTMALAVGTSANVMADSIDSFNQSWVGQALDLQRGLDVNAPIIDNNILGTHNTYNSEVYTACDFSVGCRYLDPQQKYSIKDQLRMGARFIELDVHWTTKMEGIFSYPKRLLLCHGVCSINDKYATEGFDEIKSWLNDSANADEVIILYIEDDSENHHVDLYNQLTSRFGSKIYASGGCGNIPDNLTKADVLVAGKQVILWKDGGCSGNASMADLAYSGLGNVGRIWEDGTTLGTISEFFTGGIDSISASEVSEAFATGGNIVNLDDMVMNDDRIEAAVWSWNTNEPNDYNGNEDCATQTGSSRWNDVNCNNAYAYACEDNDGNWAVPYSTTGTWTNGNNACASLGADYHFSVPTNSQSNQALKTVKEASGYSTVWLNYEDRSAEGNWAGVQLNAFAELRDQRAGLCMNLWGGNAYNGADVRLHNCSGTSNERWWYEVATGLIRSELNPNYCLDMMGGNIANGGNVQVWTCITGHQNMTWDIVGDTIRPRVNNNLAIDAYGDDSGDNIGLWSVHGGSNQSWSVQ